MTEIINNIARKQLLSDPAYDDGFGVMGVNDAKGRENLVLSTQKTKAYGR